MVRLLNAGISQPPPPPRVEGWEWGWRGARPWLRVHDVWVWECWGTLFSRITQPKINCNENTNNDKCSLPVIVAESLIDIVVIIGKALQQLQPGTAPCISAFFKFQAQNDTRRAPAGPGPCGPVRGWGVDLHVCGTMSWFPAANSLLEFLCLIIKKARSLKSWKNLISNPHYHYQKNY